MKILNLSLDKSALDQNSKTAKRIAEYRSLVDKYIILFPEDKFKVIGLFNIYNQAKKIIRKEKIDVITVQDQYYLAFIGWVLARKFKIGLELQVHGFEKYYGARKLIAKFIIKRADAIRAVSERLKNLLIKDFKVKEEKITVIPIYSEIKSAEHEARSVEKNGNNFVFLTVGRLAPVKNIALQIKALAEISGNYPDTELWIVGEGSEEEKLKKSAEGLNVGDKVKFLGWQDDVEKFYAQADVFLLTSNSEGWGLAAIEAASFGLPIIMTDVGCAGEAIISGQSGIVIPVGGKEELKNAMIKVLEDGEFRKKIGEQARKNVGNLPTKEQTFALYKKSWEKAIKIK